MVRLAVLILCYWLALPARADFVVSHTFLEEDLATSSNVGYEVQLLIMALDATVEDFGDYTLAPVEKSITQLRAIEFMESNRYPNYVRTLGYNQVLSEKRGLDYVRFPAYLGILGYRTCFVSRLIEEKFAAVTTREALLGFSQAIGLGWADAEILRAAGFEVQEIPDWNSMYQMTARNRVDLFCRGAGEVLADYRKNMGVEGLAFDRAIAIYYPLPHFFYTNDKNKVLLNRLTVGLHRIYADGSLQALWKQKFQGSIDFIKLDRRRLFRFDSPLVHSIDFDYSQYVYRPR